MKVSESESGERWWKRVKESEWYRKNSSQLSSQKNGNGYSVLPDVEYDRG